MVKRYLDSGKCCYVYINYQAQNKFSIFDLVEAWTYLGLVNVFVGIIDLEI